MGRILNKLGENVGTKVWLIVLRFHKIRFSVWLIDWFNFVYRRYSAKLLIQVVDVPTSPERKCNIHVYDTALQPLYPRDVIILTSLVLVHAGYLFCNWHPLNTNYYGTTYGGMPGSFNSSQIYACVVGIGVLGPRFIVSSEGLGLHKMLPPRGFEPSTSRMLGKHRTPRPRLPPYVLWIDMTVVKYVSFYFI